MKSKIIFTAFLGFFLLMRLWVLTTNIEAVSDLEELGRGTLAKEITEGLKMPFWDYQIDDYSGGSLIIGILSAPFFLILGPTLPTLKIAPLLLSLLCLWITFAAVRRHWGDKAALWFASLFVFAPATFFRFSLVAMGFHSEALAGIALLLYFFYHWTSDAQPRSAFLFGITSALSFWFCPIAGIAVLGCLLSVFALKIPGKALKVSIPAFLGGSVLGLAPYLFYNFTHDFRGVKFLVLTFFSPSSASTGNMASRIGELLVSGFPQSLGMEKLPAAIYALLAFLILAFTRKSSGPRQKELPLVFTLILFILFYSLSGFSLEQESYIDSRYFVVFHYVVFLLLAVRISQSKIKGIAGLLLILFGLISQSALLKMEAREINYRGYSYQQLGWTWGRFLQTPEGRAKMAGVLSRLKPEDRLSLERGLAYGLPAEPEEQKEALQLFSPETEPFLEEAKGYQQPLENLRSRSDQNITYRIGMANTLYRQPWPWLETHWEEWRAQFAENEIFDFAGGGILFRHFEHERKAREKFAAYLFEPRSSIWITRGVGKEIGGAWVYDRRPLQRMLSLLPPLPQKELYWGIGWGVQRELLEDPLRAQDWISQLPETYRANAQAGAENCRKWFLP